MMKNYAWKVLLTTVIAEETRWLWKYGSREDVWLAVLGAYLIIPLGIPRAIHRQIKRRWVESKKTAAIRSFINQKLVDFYESPTFPH